MGRARTGKRARAPKKVSFHGEVLTRAHALRMIRTRIKVIRCAEAVAPALFVPVEYVVARRPDDPARRPNAETEARALTAYLAHTGLGVSKKLISRVLDMEWSQLNRAISAIEDKRDHDGFDAMVERLERAIGIGEGGDD